jgi:hypothetical protein
VSFRSWETFFQFSAWEFAAASMRFCRSDFSLSSFFVTLKMEFVLLAQRSQREAGTTCLPLPTHCTRFLK